MVKLFVPPTPSSDEAREVAERELAKAKYSTDPGFIDQFKDKVIDRIFDALSNLTGTGNSTLLIIIVTIIAVLIVAFALSRVRRRGIQSSVEPRANAPMFDDERSSAELFASADDAERWGNLNLALVERFRGIIRLLDEKALLTVVPGLTANEAARAGASAISSPDALHATAHVFDSIYYGDGHATHEDCALATFVAGQAREAQAQTSGSKNELVAL